jgi:hypothetical protein
MKIFTILMEHYRSVSIYDRHVSHVKSIIPIHYAFAFLLCPVLLIRYKLSFIFMFLFVL